MKTWSEAQPSSAQLSRQTRRKLFIALDTPLRTIQNHCIYRGVPKIDLADHLCSLQYPKTLYEPTEGFLCSFVLFRSVQIESVCESVVGGLHGSSQRAGKRAGGAARAAWCQIISALGYQECTQFKTMCWNIWKWYLGSIDTAH